MKKELWLRLQRYHFDHLVPAQLTDHVRAAFGGADASTMAFASKVARKLGWTRPFALRAIHEYKKFVYLGVVSDSGVTPPKVIDQVWHEHLLFTRAYRDFCRDVLGRDFDHNPELVQSKSQTELFQVQYAATLVLYHTEFHREPPAEIWGTPKFKAGPVTNKPSPRKRSSGDDGSVSSEHGSSYESEPLHTFFFGSGGDSGGSSGASHFGGGGGFSGGGSSASWDDPSDGHGDAGHGGDSDSGSDGGDGGGDGGGSGCSSSCGGGGD
ncbi:MAG: hypothetical protein K8S21_01535 [Gemmatimonadetes bacterium]|nr:hypothetical protein [Gemmatimonadota bacterium]